MNRLSRQVSGREVAPHPHVAPECGVRHGRFKAVTSRGQAEVGLGPKCRKTDYRLPTLHPELSCPSQPFHCCPSAKVSCPFHHHAPSCHQGSSDIPFPAQPSSPPSLKSAPCPTPPAFSYPVLCFLQHWPLSKMESFV